MNVEEKNIYSEVPEELIIDISGLNDTNDISKEMIDDLAYLDHLIIRERPGLVNHRYQLSKRY